MQVASQLEVALTGRGVTDGGVTDGGVTDSVTGAESVTGQGGVAGWGVSTIRRSTIPGSWPDFPAQTGIWQHHGSTMAVPWQHHGSTMAVPALQVD